MPQQSGIVLFHESATQPLAQPDASVPSSASNRAVRYNPSNNRTKLKSTSNNDGSLRSYEHTTMLFDPDSPILEDWRPLPTSQEQDVFAPAPSVSHWGVVFGTLVGAGLGVLLNYFQITSEVQKLVALPGNMFLHALQCLFIPMVFCVTTIAVVDAVSLRRTSILRLNTVMPYLLTSLLATTQGVGLALAFQSLWAPQTLPMTHSTQQIYNITLGCPNGLNRSLLLNGTLECAISISTDVIFVAANHSTWNMANTTVQMSLMDKVTELATLVVTDNIFKSLVQGSLLSIVVFSLLFGYGIACSTPLGDHNPVVQLVRQSRNIFLIMINGILKLTPLAIVFLMASAVAKFESRNTMVHVGYLLGAFHIGVACHVLMVLPLYLYFMTHSNPFKLIQHLLPAYIFAFSSACSMTTLPVSITCLVVRAKLNREVVYLTMPFGTSINMNASGLYYPLAIVFMANMEGLGDLLTPSTYAILFFVSLLGSMGTAPGPNASLVFLLTVWKTCFPSQASPSSFTFIVAADFVIDRIRTMVNVNGNAVVTRILADHIEETFEVHAGQHL